MTDAEWRELLRAFVERSIDEAEFHDRFFALWHRVNVPAGSVSPAIQLPHAIEELFYVVEAYCPDPTLRDPNSLYEADDVELRRSAEIALSRIAPSPR